MQKEKTNIEHLRAIINEKMFDKDEALEFLEAIEKEIDDNDTITDLQYDLNKSESRVDELLSEIEELKDAPTEFEIDCGIGQIQYNADNIQLQILMENLAERIEKYGALKTLQMLQIPQHA